MEEKEFDDLVEKWFDKSLKIVFYFGIIVIILAVLFFPLKLIFQNGTAIYKILQEYSTNNIDENSYKFDAISKTLEERQKAEQIMDLLNAEWECLEFGFVNTTVPNKIPLDCNGGNFEAKIEESKLHITSKEEVCIKWQLIRKSNK